jgi:hypothetical protein
MESYDVCDRLRTTKCKLIRPIVSAWLHKKMKFLKLQLSRLNVKNSYSFHDINSGYINYRDITLIKSLSHQFKCVQINHYSLHGISTDSVMTYSTLLAYVFVGRTVGHDTCLSTISCCILQVVYRRGWLRGTPFDGWARLQFCRVPPYMFVCLTQYSELVAHRGYSIVL